MAELIKKLIDKNCSNGYVDLKEEDINNLREENKLTYLAVGGESALDSELLLSFIYRKLGLKNPQSFPAKYKGRSGIIREKIEDNKDYIHNKLNNYGSNCIYFSSLQNARALHPFFEKELMDSYIKMSISDVIFNIQDRFQSHIFLHKKQYGYLDKVAPISFGYPGYAFKSEVYRLEQSYFNGVRLPEEAKRQYKKNLREYDFENFIKPSEVFELLRKIDIKNCAKEVYELTGHKINTEFVNYIKQTLEDNINYLSNKNI